MKVVVIIPTYNEAGNIGLLIDKIQKVFKKVVNHQTSILVVDDNSPDGTADIVKNKQKKYKNLHLILGKKEGLGRAYLRGMKFASEKLKAQVMFEHDADFQHNPELIPKFLKKIDQGYDLVIGSRYIRGGSIPHNWGLHRKIFSIFGNFIVQLALFNFSHKDWTTGYRALRTPLYKKLRSQLEEFKGYTFQVSFLHKALLSGAKVTEVPMVFLDRVRGESKIGSAEYIFNLIKYLIISDITNPPRVLRFLVVGTIGFTINSLGLAVFQRVGLKPSLSAALGAELAIISNFIWNNFWTFSDRKLTHPNQLPKKFVLFNLASFGSVVIQFVTIETATNLFGQSPLVVWTSFILGVFLGLIWNFTMYNKLIWKVKDTSKTAS